MPAATPRRAVRRLAAGLLLVLGLAATTAACSSSGGGGSANPTVPAPTTTDPPAATAAFCTAWRQLNQLSQITSGTDLSQVASNIVGLRAVAHQFATAAPPSIAGPAKRYALIVGAVADTLAQSPPSSVPKGSQLTAQDRAVLAAYEKAHCEKH